jgi:hypothetical protein
MRALGRRLVRDGAVFAAALVLMAVTVSQAGTASRIGLAPAEPPPSGITTLDPNLIGVKGPQALLPTLHR